MKEREWRDVAAGILCRVGAAGGSIPQDLVGGSDSTESVRDALERLRRDRLVTVEGVEVRIGPASSPLDGERLAGLRQGGLLGRTVEVLASTPSTNDVAAQRAAGGCSPGHVVCAERQTAGRGRHGRAFDSAPGLGIWSSTLLPPPPDPRLAPRISLIAALAVARVAEATTGKRTEVKWPNDVLLGGRKVCGILVEARSAGGRVHPVAGIGLNVHHQPADFPPEIQSRAGSLAQATDRRLDRTTLLAGVLEELEGLLSRDETGELDLAAAFADRSAARESEITVSTAGGTLTGVQEGIADDGGLLLRVPGRGTVVVRAGDVVGSPST